jgi:LPS-assembly protein
VAGPPAQGAPPAAPPDGLQPGELYMEADLVVRDDHTKVTTAKGEVEVRYEGRTLRADQVTYDQQRAVINAQGHVTIVNADGTTEFADEMTLDDKMRAGVAEGFAARLQQNIKIASATAVQRSDEVQELNRAIYTACEICAKDKPKEPTWSIQADRIVRDKDRQLIYYRNATIRIMGVPVLYLPIFWHADPQAKRKSGLLQPDMSVSDRRGFSYEQPYLFVLSPYSDLTLSPQINTKVHPFLNGQVRKRFYSGSVEARFGYTYDKDFDGEGRQFGDATSRSYILASGAFRIDPKWLWGFTAERTSDDLLFDKYQVGRVYISRGPFIADDRRLISQVYTVRQDQRSYFSAAAFSIQGLRPTDNDRTFPVVAPLIDARWEPAQPIAGGRLRLRASGVVLTREQSQFNTVTREPGMDSTRGTVEADWRGFWTSGGGLRVEPFMQARADGYTLHDLPTGSTSGKNFGRGLAVAGADITWPVFRRFSASTVVLSPVAQVAISPQAKNILLGFDATGQPIYLDEDSQAFEFDETNLFKANKFTGFDLYEDGARLNVGGRATVLWDDGRRANLLFGRSLRDERNNVFPARTGLQPKASDWILAADAQVLPGLAVFARTRLDSENLRMHRGEFGANFATKRSVGFVRYLYD